MYRLVLPVCITNATELFHMGIIHGGASSGCRYGYFSNFNSIVLNLVNQVSFCPGETYTIDAGGGKDNYLWNTGDTTQTLSVSNEGVYWVSVTKENCIGSDTVYVSILPEPIINLGNDSTYCNGPVLLDAKNMGTKYLWNTGDSAQTVSVCKSGSYSVTVNNGLCKKNSKVEITIKDYKTFPSLQNIFTPNGDGINDLLDLGTFAADEHDVKIYSRWGNLVFQTTDENNNWDGKIKDKLADIGTYYIILKYKSFCTNNEFITKKGFVTLLR